MQNATLLEITCHGSILVQRIMDYVQRLQLRICSLNWKSSDKTGHDTGLGTGLSLARGSGYCFYFPAAFLFDGMTDFVKG